MLSTFLRQLRQGQVCDNMVQSQITFYTHSVRQSSNEPCIYSLWSIQYSLYSHRVHIALEETKAQYTSVIVDLMNKPAWFKDKVNALGQVSSTFTALLVFVSLMRTLFRSQPSRTEGRPHLRRIPLLKLSSSTSHSSSPSSWRISFLPRDLFLPIPSNVPKPAFSSRWWTSSFGTHSRSAA